MKCLKLLWMVLVIAIFGCGEKIERFKRDISLERIPCGEMAINGVFFLVSVECGDENLQRRKESCKIQDFSIATMDRLGRESPIQKFANVVSAKQFSEYLFNATFEYLDAQDKIVEFLDLRASFLNKKVSWDSVLTFFSSEGNEDYPRDELQELSEMVIVDHKCGGIQPYWFMNKPDIFVAQFNNGLSELMKPGSDKSYCGLGINIPPGEISAIIVQCKIGGKLVTDTLRI